MPKQKSVAKKPTRRLETVTAREAFALDWIETFRIVKAERDRAGR